MNQFPDNDALPLSNENATSAATRTPVVVMSTIDTHREPIEQVAQQQDSTIIAQSAEATAYLPVPQADFRNFDALDYARLSSQPPTSTRHADSVSIDTHSIEAHLDDAQSIDVQSVDTHITRQFGEVDPYVDPTENTLNGPPKQQSNIVSGQENELLMAELANFDSQPHSDSANQTLQEIDDFQKQLELLESQADIKHCPLSPPAVEIIGAKSEHIDRVEKPQNHLGGAPLESADDELPPVAWFADTETAAADKHETAAHAPVPGAAIPIVNQETGDSIFDVRDFCDSANDVPEPIAGSFELDPDLFEFKTVDEIKRSNDSRQTTAGNEEQIHHLPDVQPGPSPDGQVFVAGAGDVIRVDGRDGFDHIDLACFEVKWASFSKQVIQIDDQQGMTFEIHYQNIPYALFADGIEVQLDFSDDN